MEYYWISRKSWRVAYKVFSVFIFNGSGFNDSYICPLSFPRGANPFACKICLFSIRNACPTYTEIKTNLVRFNEPIQNDGEFSILTSMENNISSGQNFVSCSGKSAYDNIIVDFSVADIPTGFSTFPAARHGGVAMTVEQFILKY